MSQSKKGSCQGLWSAIEGDRTYTLKKGRYCQNLLYHEETHNDVGENLSFVYENVQYELSCLFLALKFSSSQTTNYFESSHICSLFIVTDCRS